MFYTCLEYEIRFSLSKLLSSSRLEMLLFMVFISCFVVSVSIINNYTKSTGKTEILN